MKKILKYLLLFTGLNVFSQSTLIKLKQIEYGPGAGYLPITTGASTAIQYTNTLPASVIPTLSTYVPYSGANSFTTSNSITAGTLISTALTSTAITIAGASGAGNIYFPRQLANPSGTLSTGFRLFADIAAALSWRVDNGSDNYIRKFSGSLTANRAYTLPDASGTVALTSDLSTFITNTLTVPLYLSQSSSTLPSLNFPLSGTVPASPTDGMMYWDNSATFGGLTEYYNGTANYNHTWSNGTTRGIAQTFTSSVYGGAFLLGTGSTHPFALGVNQDLGQSPAAIITAQTSGAVNCFKVMGGSTTYTGTSSFQIAQGSGTHIVRVTNAAETVNYFTIAPTTGNATFSNTATTFSGNISLAAAGNKMLIKTGTGASLGTATLSAGTVSVANTNITANSKIFITPRGITNAGFLGTTLAASTGFTISSSSGTDARVVDYFIIEGQ